MQYRLIALDLDGTLLGSNKEISPRTLAALAAAQERGILTVIATGRTPHSARLISRRIGGGPVICCNGGAILDQSGGYIIQKGIAPVPLRRVLELCRQEQVLAECYTPGGVILDQPLAHLRAYRQSAEGRTPAHRSLWALFRIWQINRIRLVRSLIRWAEQPQLPPVMKLMLIGEPERLQRLAEQVRRQVPGVEITSSGVGNLEITAAGVSKGWGLEMLGARLKIPRQAMIACGDSANDLTMLGYAGMGVAMGNGSDEAKAAADRVTATCDQDGVALVVEELCLN